MARIAGSRPAKRTTYFRERFYHTFACDLIFLLRVKRYWTSQLPASVREDFSAVADGMRSIERNHKPMPLHLPRLKSPHLACESDRRVRRRCVE